MEKLVGGYMAKGPYVVGPETTVREALGLMRELDIRHLPVVEDDELLGLVSDRDLREALGRTPDQPVGQVMCKDVYIATTDTPLASVVAKMIDQKVGSVLVVNDDDEIQGIFTTIDALRVLHEMLADDDGDAILDGYFEDWSRFNASAEA